MFQRLQDNTSHPFHICTEVEDRWSSQTLRFEVRAGRGITDIGGLHSHRGVKKGTVVRVVTIRGELALTIS